MEKCALLWLGRGETEALPWIAAELKDYLAYTKDYEVTWNARIRLSDYLFPCFLIATSD